MTRPGFALTVLLVTLTGSLLAVRIANSQERDHHVGGLKYRLCPLISDELYDGGFGAHACDVGSLPHMSEVESAGVPKSFKIPFWSLTTCSVSEWFREWTAPSPATRSTAAVSHDLYLSGHDPVYDKAVYGVEPRSTTAGSAKQKYVAEDWAGWDWCEGECGQRVTVQSAPAVTAVAKKPMEEEPLGIEEYYSMYGGKHYRIIDYSVYDDNYGYEPARVGKDKLSIWLRNWSQKHAVLLDWEAINDTWISRRDQCVHQLMVSRYWPICADFYRTWQQQRQVQLEARLAGAEKACGRLAVRTVAQSLDQAAAMLQNASRCLTQLVENPPVPVSTQLDTADQR